MTPIETILDALCAGQTSLSEAEEILAQAHAADPALAPQRLDVVAAYQSDSRLSTAVADRLRDVLRNAEPVEKRTLFRPPGATGGATGSPGSAPALASVATGSNAAGPEAPGQWAATGGASSGTFSNWPPPTTGHEPPVDVGTILRDRFYIEKVVGAGGMGVVFRALDRRREEAQDRHPHVAIKVLGEDFKNHPDALVALQREARRMQQLSHPRIAAVYDFDRDGSHVYLVMELLEGDSLDHIVTRQSGTAMPSEQALKVIAGAGDALSYAHSRGVVHSDFKPANVFVTSNGDVKVFDFGIARIAKDSAQAGDAAHTIFDAGKLGAMTNAYASPEQILDTAAPDPRDDVYAFALVAYEVLSGKHPFERKSAVEAQHRGMTMPPIAQLSDRQNEVLASALSFSREARLGDIMSLVEALSESDVDRVGRHIIVPPREGSARPVTAEHREPEAGKSKRPLVIAAAIAALGLLFGGYWYATQRGVAPVATDAAPVPGDVAAVPVEQGTLAPAPVAESVAEEAGASPDVAGPEPAVVMAPPEPRPVATDAVPKADETVDAGTTAQAAEPVEEPAAADSAAPPVPPAGGPGLYRWVDGNGDVQFGENPPREFADSAVKVMDL